MPGIDALPYALLLLTSEFAVGTLLSLFAIDLRGTVPRGLLKMGAGVAIVATGLSLWIAVSVPASGAVDGYGLAAHYLQPVRFALTVTLILSITFAVAIWMGRRTAELIDGVVTSAAALATLGLITTLIRPAAGFAPAFVSLLAGSVALGGVTLAMTLGHWYLVTPRLPEQPLNEMTLRLLAIIGAQVLLLGLNVALLSTGGRQPPVAAAVPLGQNPALWLRIGVGLGLAGLLTFMAWQSSRARGMMSATGLLYLATGAVLAGQALACALLFTTGIP